MSDCDKAFADWDIRNDLIPFERARVPRKETFEAGYAAGREASTSQEPSAWICKGLVGAEKVCDECEPLYTHPEDQS